MYRAGFNSRSCSSSTGVGPLKSERILIADDEGDVLELCQRILSKEGYRVSIVNSGLAAIDKVASEHFDLVLTDIKMPGLNGLETSRAIKKVKPHVICMVMTGFATKETAIEALKLGVDEFVVKPFSPEELNLAVASVLEKERLRQENSRLRALIPLFELNKLFMGRLTLPSLLPEVLAIAQREVKADYAAVHLLSAGGEFSSNTKHNLDPIIVEEFEQFSRAYIDQVVDNHHLLTPGLQSTDQLEPIRSDSPGWSVIASPLLSQQTLMGVLMLAKHQERFTASDRDFVTVLSSQVAIAVENARLFAEVRQAYENLQALDHLKSEFINIAAHELRTPLAILIGYANILEDTATGEDHSYLTIIVRNALRLKALIDDMLNMRFIETGKVQFEPKVVSLNQVVASVLNDLQLLAQERLLSVTSTVADDLPTFLASPQNLERILSNLISNAIKFTPEGGKITVDAGVVGDMIHVSVQDTGLGIPAEKLEKIFERFYQVEDSLTRGHEGLGLGLSIAKGLVELGGGQIWVKSRVGRGSTFTLSIPLDPPD
jgi:signal transduction histidine kinase